MLARLVQRLRTRAFLHGPKVGAVEGTGPFFPLLLRLLFVQLYKPV